MRTFVALWSLKQAQETVTGEMPMPVPLGAADQWLANLRYERDREMEMELPPMLRSDARRPNWKGMLQRDRDQRMTRKQVLAELGVDLPTKARRAARG